MKGSGDRFYLNVVPGLEKMAAREATALAGTKAQPLEAGQVRVDSSAGPQALLNLRLAEDVFARLAEWSDLSRSRSELGRISRALNGAALSHGLRLWHAATGRRLPGRTTYRVIARKSGQHNFLRADMADAVERGVHAWSRGRWQPVADGAHIEIWIEVTDSHGLLGLRLSDRTMRHRTYKREHVEASLRPTVAQAMVLLSGPRPDDVFCDPMCGAGTLLIERGEAGRYQLLLGGDRSRAAVEAAKANVGPRYKPIELRQWDATQLPLDAGSVSVIAVNPPFGRKIGTLDELKTLYPAFLREAERVLAPGGRLVVITDREARPVLERAMRGAALAPQRRLNIELLGRASVIQTAVRV